MSADVGSLDSHPVDDVLLLDLFLLDDELYLVPVFDSLLVDFFVGVMGLGNGGGLLVFDGLLLELDGGVALEARKILFGKVVLILSDSEIDP